MRLFQTHDKWCVPAVYAQILKCIRSLTASKAKVSNFKLLGTLPNNAEAGKNVSVTDSYHGTRNGNPHGFLD